MEEQKNNKGLIIIICVLCVLVLALGGYIVYDKLNEEKVVDDTPTETKQENTTTATDIKVTNFEGIFDESDTEVVKAQKIAKEVMTAINNKDLARLEQMMGYKPEYIIEYDIHNYNVDVDNHEYIEDEYVFTETYEGNTITSGGQITGYNLIIRFETDGKIHVEPTCSGI